MTVKNVKRLDTSTTAEIRSLSSSKRCIDAAMNMNSRSIEYMSFTTMNAAVHTADLSSIHTSTTVNLSSKSYSILLDVELSSFDMATQPSHSTRSLHDGSVPAASGERKSGVDETKHNSRTGRKKSGVTDSCRTPSPLPPVLPKMLPLSAEEVYEPQSTMVNQELSSRSEAQDVNVKGNKPRRNNDDDADKKEQRRRGWSVRDPQKSVGEHFCALLPSKKATVSDTTVNTTFSETNSCTAHPSAADMTNAHSVHASLPDDLTTPITGAPYNMDLFSYATALQPTSSTPSLHLVGAPEAAADEEGKGETEEKKTKSRTRRNTTGIADRCRPHALLPPVKPRVRSVSSVRKDEPQHTLFNEEVSSPTGAQGSRKDGNGDAASGEKQKKRRWSVRDFHQKVVRQLRSMLPCEKDTNSTADTGSDTDVNNADARANKWISESMNQPMEPIESSALPSLTQQRERAATEGDGTAGGGLHLPSITRRAPTSSNANADSEPDDAAPVPPLQRDAQVQLAKWKRNVSLENARRRSMNENSMELRCSTSAQFDDMVEVGASLQSWRGAEYPAAGRLPRTVRVACVDNPCTEWNENEDVNS
ncbi:signal peptide protein [Strigomonas culicis]|uniref:Signal peptide protein n=1 Tax=Strigomonas culicis TaxID=28005 RepID=S9TPT5_9TRYP|nr:signal peptide protein [Strigomonas culicis]|eukprot:EPY18483.1 signal peptide protein [Strigomonas culicis]